MELVGELTASHHLASRPARVVGDVGIYGEMGRGGWRGALLMRLHRDPEKTPHHPNISPHISHATQAERRAAAAAAAVAPSTTSLSFFREAVQRWLALGLLCPLHTLLLGEHGVLPHQ